jgi:beta-lactam-binding protein with PASTA domain
LLAEFGLDADDPPDVPAEDELAARSRCRIGAVSARFSKRVPRSRVISQTPRAGRRLAVGARVAVTISKGKPRARR